MKFYVCVKRNFHASYESKYDEFCFDSKIEAEEYVKSLKADGVTAEIFIKEVEVDE